MSEPVLIIARRWKCPHCSRSRSSKQATAGHIARCWRNPETASCWTCANWEPPGSGEPCEGSRPCGCNNSPAWCTADQAVPADGKPLTDCPLWAPAITERNGQ